eukprot:366556-Chlamydomonas_euryale.AAC.14
MAEQTGRRCPAACPPLRPVTRTLRHARPCALCPAPCGMPAPAPCAPHPAACPPLRPVPRTLRHARPCALCLAPCGMPAPAPCAPHPAACPPLRPVPRTLRHACPCALCPAPCGMPAPAPCAPHPAACPPLRPVPRTLRHTITALLSPPIPTLCSATKAGMTTSERVPTHCLLTRASIPTSALPPECPERVCLERCNLPCRLLRVSRVALGRRRRLSHEQLADKGDAVALPNLVCHLVRLGDARKRGACELQLSDAEAAARDGVGGWVGGGVLDGRAHECEQHRDDPDLSVVGRQAG